MNTKRFVLATAMIVFVAMSGQAYAGTTISDTRYWPSEASSADQNAVHHSENAFYSAQATVATAAQTYQGGPKGSDY
jgi:hypothetical protein